MSVEQKRAALRELSRDGEAYRFLLSESDLAVLVLSENVEDCNEAACRMFGVRREAFIGRSPLEFAPPQQPDGSESEPAARERLASALAGLPQWCEWQYRRDDGTLVDTLDHVEAVQIDGARRLLVRIRDVSRMRRAEDALAQSETRLQQILNNTTTAIVFAKDLANRYLFVNRAFERIVGLPADQIIGKTTTELFPQTVAAELRRNDEQVVATGETILVEEQVRIGGVARTLLTNKFPLFDTHGEPYATCGIAADITERKATEDALQRAALAVSGAEGEGVFDVLVRSLASIVGMEFAFIALRVPENPNRLHMLAFEIDGELREQGDYGLVGTPCDDVVGKSFQLYTSGVRRRFPGDPDFKLPGIESYAGCPLSDGAGESIGVMSVASRKPITNAARVEAVLRIFAARAMAELERRRAEEATRLGEAQYRAIFDASEDAIYVHDWDSGAIVDVNPRVSEMSGYSREELLNKSPAMLSADDPEQAGMVAKAALERARRGETVRIEFRRRNKDGSLHWDEVSLKSAELAGKPRLLAIVREITERKHAEEALRASEEQYRAIFNASEDALVLWDSKLQRVDVNPAYQRIFGWTRAEVIGHAFLQRALPTEYTERRLELVRRALAGEATNVEIESVRKSGERFHAELRNIPIRYRGEPHVLAIVRDVTERKQRDAALRTSEEQYRAVFNASLDALVLRDETFQIVDVNPAYERLSGYRRDEVIGADYVVANPEGVNEQVKALHLRALAGETIRLETQIMRRDGVKIDIELSGIRTLYEGKPHVLYSGRDVTERRKAVERLRTSEEQYRAIFNAAADSVVLRDAAFRIVDVNPAYEAMSGRSRAEAIGRQELTMSSPELNEMVKNLHHRAIAGTPVQWEADARRKNGESFVIETRGVPIQYKGEPHVLYVGRDITARKRADAERTELEAQLRQAQKMEAIGHLTGGIAHDFNNILTGIMGYLVLASERPATLDDPRLARHLDQARVGAQRARDLIQQMLMFSRGGKGTPQAVSIAPLIAEAASLLHSSMPATIDLRTELERGLPQIKIDPVQLEQVLLNLCINARDAMNGAGTMRVRASQVDASGLICASCKHRLDGRFVEIAVEDSGHGITPEVLERVFEPFFSTKEVGRGSGMGLASVHGIVHEHGGHIVVDTAPGKGTTFRIALPALAESAKCAADAMSAARSPVAGPLRGRVLLVDDERLVADFMAELLESWGLKVKVKRNPLDAEEWFDRNAERVQVVVTDQTMPKMTGLELARRLRARRPGLPVILYTGYAEGITEKQLAASGVRTLMRKPIEPADLRAELVKYLGGAPEPSAPEARGPSRVPRERKAATAKAATGKAASGRASPRKAVARKTKGRAAQSRASARRAR